MGYGITLFGALIGALLVLKWTVQLWLERLNDQNVRAHAGAVPELLRSVVDASTYARTVEYTLAKSKVRKFELTYGTLLVALALFSGVLPFLFGFFQQHLGRSTWAMACFLFTVGLIFSILELPIDWYVQFHLEQRFGFNNSSPKLWWNDRLKALALGALLGYPLLVLIVFFVSKAGVFWWLWVWAALLAFQLLMALLAPVLIMPLFNKFTPLPDGSLRDRLLKLAQRTAFRAQSIQVMDGSKRSGHSNAFFTGFGRFRKIVLFDTLIQQLPEAELEAVLAHEIGHFKKRHIPKMLVASALGSLAGLYVLSWLVQQPWFYQAFGFAPGNFVPALLLFGLLSGAVTFWLSPLLHGWSRRYEYQADGFAAQTMGEPHSLVGALRKLNEQNLSNLTPHPLYSGFYYSHPTLIEREEALLRIPATAQI